uniref:Uncharacterized protein n=1 Tax=Arundo donax TaxID=35708 RepID=A0A0A9BF25_ARUDO
MDSIDQLNCMEQGPMFLFLCSFLIYFYFFM